MSKRCYGTKQMCYDQIKKNADVLQQTIRHYD